MSYYLHNINKLNVDVAEWVLNECIQVEKEKQSQEFTDSDDVRIQNDGGELSTSCYS